MGESKLKTLQKKWAKENRIGWVYGPFPQENQKKASSVISIFFVRGGSGCTQIGTSRKF